MASRGPRREFLWVAGSQAVVLAAGLLAVKALTNLMTAHSYGEFSLALSLAAVAGSLIYGPMSQVATRFYSVARERNQYGAFFKWIFRTYARTFLGVLICATLGIAGALLWIDSRWAWLIACAASLSLATGANGVMVATLNGMRARRAMATVQLADSLTKVALMILVVALVSRTSQAAVAAGALGAALVTFFSYRYFARKVLPVPGSEIAAATSGAYLPMQGEMTGYMLPFVVLALIGMVALVGDRWIIQSAFGEAEVGIYSAMYQIVNGPISVALSFINQFSYPIVFARAGDLSAAHQRQVSKGDYRNVLLISAAFIGLLAGGAYLFGEQILTTFTSTQFARHHDVLWILVLALSLFHLAQQMTLLGFAVKKPSAYVFPKLTHSLTFFVLAIAIGINHGLRGIAAALAISSAIYFALVYRANRQMTRQLKLSDDEQMKLSDDEQTSPRDAAVRSDNTSTGSPADEPATAPTRTTETRALAPARPAGDRIPRSSFTVVIPVFNMKNHLEETIKSVLVNIGSGDQLFIVDGGSTDGTVDIIKTYERQLTGWVSEPDRGYADAIAKGFSQAKGELLCWINSGDLLLPGAVDAASRELNQTGVDLIYGDDFYIDESGRVISYSRGYIGAELDAFMLYGGWTPLQDACFWRRELYQSVGGIDPSVRYAADYDLFLRLALRGRTQYVPLAFSAFRRHAGQMSISRSEKYHAERTFARRRELAGAPGPLVMKTVRSVWHSTAVRWRIHVTQKSWERPDLRGRPISEFECRNYCSVGRSAP